MHGAAGARGLGFAVVLLAGLGAGGSAVAADGVVAPGFERWVAADGVGRQDGTRPEDAATAADGGFWAGVSESLLQGAVRVHVLPGRYTRTVVRLEGVGHPEHTLFIAGDPGGGTVFEEPAGEDLAAATGLFFKGCRNVQLTALHFTGAGHTGYITQMSDCQDMLWEACTWVDLPNIRFGATGTTGAKTRHVVYRVCTFRRIGSHGGAHMIYNAYEPKHVYVVGCTFEDCAGDYVRWRAGTDYAAAIGCTFTSTGTWPPLRPGHQPFLSVPLFADRDPGDEVFGTHFLITGNTFVVQGDKDAAPGTLIRFHHSGFDPPGKRHLLTPAEGAILTQGTVAQRRALLKGNCGLDFEEIVVFGNTVRGPLVEATFHSQARFGAVSRGWEQTVPVGDLVNRGERRPDWVLVP